MRRVELRSVWRRHVYLVLKSLEASVTGTYFITYFYAPISTIVSGVL